MTSILFLFMLLGIGYVSWQLTRFLVWLDGADERGEDAAETPEGGGTGRGKERRGAA